MLRKKVSGPRGASSLMFFLDYLNQFRVSSFRKHKFTQGCQEFYMRI